MGLDDLRSWLTEGSAPATGQRAIDPSRPRLSNPDGSFSTEETIGIEADGKHYNIPTIVGGKRVTDEQAIAAWRSGTNPEVGRFNTRAEADAAGPARSAAIGNVARESDLKAKGAVMFTPAEQRANTASETSPRALAEAQHAVDTAKTPQARAALQESLDQTLTMGGEAPRRAIGLGSRGGHFQGLADWLKEGSQAGTEPASAPAAPVEEPGIVRKAVDSVLNVLRPVDRTKQDKRIAAVADKPWEQANAQADALRQRDAEPGIRRVISQMRTENIDAETAGKPLPHTPESIKTLESQRANVDVVQRGAVERGVETERKAAREVAMGDFGRNMIATAQKIDPGLGEMGPLWRGMVGGFIQAYGESWLRDLDAGYSTDHPIFGKPDDARKTFQQLAGLGEAWVDEADRRNKQITGDLKPGLGAKVADSAVTSLAMMAPALAAGALTKNPMTVIGIMSGETGAQAYGEARHEGLSPGQAGTYALLQSTIEGGTEWAGIKALFRSSRDEVKWLLRFLAREVPGEMLATTLQDAIDKVSVRPEMTVKDFGEDLITTILSTPLAAGAQAAAVRGVRGPAKGMTEDDRDEILAKFKDGMAELESVKAETAKTAKARPAPTHKLEDGTPVRQRSEGGQPVAGVWETEDGAIVEAPRADPITVPDANAEMRVGGVPYEVTVVGKGREKDTARLADGQEVPLTQIESMGDEAKDVLGLLPPDETKSAKSVTKTAKTATRKAPAATKTAVADAPAVSKPESVTSVTPAPEQGSLVAPPEPPKPIFTGKAPELEGTRSLQRQNRLRGNVASVAQMNAIAENPDYDRVSASKAPETGAPMVSISGDTEAIPAEQQGRQSVVTIGGTKVPIRYAVVESDSLLASHKADGTERPEYFADAEPGQIRALNNGRAAGLRDAYARGTAQSYREALAADPDHGIAPEAIAKLQRPILVRVYSDAFNTSIANIGEKSQGETLKQSPLEIALQDAAKLEDADFEVFDPGESGDVASAGNQKFIDLFLNKIVSAEDRGALVDQATQRPNKAAYDRIEAAVFQRAYGSQALTGMFAEAEDPEIRTVLRALAIAAPEMVKLAGVEVQLDIRPYVADAAGLFLKAKREKTTIDKLVKQGDFTLNPLVVEFANVMAEFKNAPRKLGEGLKAGAKWAQWAAAQANTADIFGDSPKYGIGDALKNIDTFMELEYGKGQAAAQDRAPYETGQGAATGEAGGRAQARGDDAAGGKQAAVDAKGKREGAEQGPVRRQAGAQVAGPSVSVTEAQYSVLETAGVFELPDYEDLRSHINGRNIAVDDSAIAAILELVNSRSDIGNAETTLPKAERAVYVRDSLTLDRLLDTMQRAASDRPVLELKGETPAELKAKEEAAAAKPPKEPKAPTPAVKRPEQVDFFDPQQQSLFQHGASYEASIPDYIQAIIRERGADPADVKVITTPEEALAFRRRYGLANMLPGPAGVRFGEGSSMFVDDDKDGLPVGVVIWPGDREGNQVDAAAADAQGHLASDAQQKVGNYEKGHVNFNPGTPLSMRASLENAAGTSRHPDWPPLKDHYGYFLNTFGYDKEQLDLFIKPGTALNWAGPVFVVNQYRSPPTQISGGNAAQGKRFADARPTFDEHKILIGYATLAEARTAYQRNYADGWDGGRTIVPITMPAFKAWAEDPSKSGPRGGPLKLSRAKALDAQHAIGATIPSLTSTPAQSDLFSAKEVPGTPALAFEKTVVGTQTIGSVSVPSGQVNGAEQAAQAFQQLRKYPSERFQVLGLNANNEPVALFDVGRGSLARVNVPFREVFTAVYQTPGIKSVWLAHQHPSGASWPSSSDQAMTENMNRGFSGHGGISIAGHVILAGNRAAELNAQGDHVRSFEVPAASQQTQSVPIVERVIESEDLNREKGLLSPDAMSAYLKTLAPKESGVLILDFQNRPVGWWPMSVAEMAKLKTGDVSTGMARLFRMVGRNNPGGAVAYSPNPMGDEAQGVFGKAVANLGAALRLVEVQMLDAFHPHKNDPGNLQSLAQKGIPTVASQFYRLAEPTVDAVTAEDARGELSSNPIYQALGDKVEVVESPYELPDEVFEQLVEDGNVDIAKALFHLGTGKIYVIASTLSRGEAETFLLHEAVGHMGIFNVLPHQAGRDLREAFLDLYRVRSADIRREARSGFLHPYRLDFRNTNHQAIAAAEWIAHQAEAEPSLWRRIVNAIRSALRKLRKDQTIKEWTDADIQHLLKLSRLSLTNANGNSVNGMPPILAALRAGETAMPNVTKAFTADGKPLLQTATVTLGDPDNLLGWIKPGVMALDYTVFDPNGDAVGNVTLDWNRESNAFDGLRFIGTNPSGQGHGDNILRSVLAYNPPQHPLRIHQILPGARAWWENRGVVVDGKGATPNGTLTRAGYVGSRTDRADTGEGRAAQAGDDAARAGQEGAFGTQGQLYALREPSSITEVYGVKDGRLLGLAARATGNVWNVYLANGTNETLFAAGQFRRMQAGSLNEVNRIFNTAGLELNVVKPRNIPVPDRSIFDQDWVAPQADNWFKRSVIYLQNRLLLPRQYEETIAKFVGPIPDSAKVHREARIAHPRAAGDIADFDHEHTEPLIAVMRRRRLSLRDVGQYLYALHAPERNAAIELKNPENKAGSGITDARAAQILADLQTRGLLPVLEREVKPIIDGIRRAREQVLIDKGLAKREVVELLRTTYPNYVPLKEIAEDEHAQEHVTPGFGVARPFSTAFGRWTEAQSEFILPGLVAQAKGAIAAGENAEVLRALLRLVSFAPNPAVWRIQKYVAKPYIDQDTGQVQFYRKSVMADADLSSRAISVPVDGDRHVIVVKDDDLARAFKSSGLPVPEAARLFGVITRFYALMATAANPEFVMVNLMRDFQQAMVRLTGEENPKLALKVAKDMLPALWGAYSGLRAKGQLRPDAGEWHRWYRRFVKAGGHVAYRGMVDTETQHKDFLTSLAEAGILPEEVRGFDKLRLKAHRAARVIGAKAMTKLVLDANGAVENALRLSAFKNAIESGMNEKDAAFLARNVTVDFNLKGEAGSQIGALYMFFNANIQGNALLFRSIINHRAMKYAVAALFFMGMGSDWWNRRWARKTEDGRNHYDNIADSVKEKNIIIMGPDRQNAITIPLSFGFNVFYVAGANAMAVMQGAKKPAEAAKATFVTMMNAFNPFGQSPSSLLGALQMVSPTPLDPSVQAMTNRNWMDKPIRPERPRFATPQSDAATYFAKTPEHWVDMARFLNEQTGGNDVRGGIIDVSPNMLQHWGHSIFGSAGGFYSRVAEAVITKAKGEKLETRDIPFLRRFYYEPKDFELSQRFYQNLNNAEVAHYEVRRAMESGNPERASVLRGEFQRERQMFGEAQMAERRVSELRKQAADIRKNDRLTRDQKRERTEKLDEQTSNTMMMFNRRYDERTER